MASLIRNVFVLLLIGFASAQNVTDGQPEGQPYTIGLIEIVANIAATLAAIAPHISLSLIILSGILYGLAQTQPAEVRGKWQTTAIALFVGGVIIGAITVAADEIQKTSGTLLISS